MAKKLILAQYTYVHTKKINKKMFYIWHSRNLYTCDHGHVK